MLVKVLGSGAGGGFPQWNCNCSNCALIRSGSLQVQRRTQSSIAVSQDGIHWVLVNASPDILHQLYLFPQSQPARQIRDTGIVAVILTDSQIDHVAGLIMLREGKKLEIYCTDAVQIDLTQHFPLFSVLDHYCGVNHHSIHSQVSFNIDKIDGITFTPISSQSKAPPYSPFRNNVDPAHNIGLYIEDTINKKSLFYAPGLRVINTNISSMMEQSSCLLVDGTFWYEDEMQQRGIHSKSAKEMGHLPQSGNDGMLAHLGKITQSRKILIHINNTNPILVEDSEERLLLKKANIEVAYDGMDIVL